MVSKNTTLIRTMKRDAQIWNEYCKTLGVPSATLFNKILNSRELKLSERVNVEARRKLFKGKGGIL